MDIEHHISQIDSLYLQSVKWLNDEKKNSDRT